MEVSLFYNQKIIIVKQKIGNNTNRAVRKFRKI